MNITRYWRAELREYLENPNKRVPHRTKAQAQNFVILERELYRKGFDGLLLKCLSFPNEHGSYASLFGRLYCQLVPKTKNWENHLPIERDLSRCIKYYLETHTGY